CRAGSEGRWAHSRRPFRPSLGGASWMYREEATSRARLPHARHRATATPCPALGSPAAALPAGTRPTRARPGRAPVSSPPRVPPSADLERHIYSEHSKPATRSRTLGPTSPAVTSPERLPGSAGRSIGEPRFRRIASWKPEADTFIAMRRLPQGTSSLLHADPGHGRRVKVMVVDDNAGFRETLLALLDTEDLLVVGEAESGPEAIELAERI